VAQSERDSFLLFVGDRLEDYHSAFKLASGGVSAMSSKQPDATSLRWQMAYPRAYAPLVSSLARAYDVPEYLVYGIMLQESRFRSYQVSSADAVGALQMIPSTAEMVAAELDIEYDARRFPEPRVGFQYSIFYMSKHLLLFENITFAAASYNGGPHRVGPWVMREKGKSMPFVVEEFAYDESRHYCRKVAEHMLRYLYLYEADVQRRGEILDALFPVEVNFDIPEDVGY
ncbi:MAG: transglycosylase SLT domain-containing protein, partial [Myxococcota bacterium]|nr:transglycosylase SLT domain-containing protein [Myxococcota bacterium]